MRHVTASQEYVPVPCTEHRTVFRGNVSRRFINSPELIRHLAICRISNTDNWSPRSSIPGKPLFQFIRQELYPSHQTLHFLTLYCVYSKGTIAIRQQSLTIHYVHTNKYYLNWIIFFTKINGM